MASEVEHINDVQNSNNFGIQAKTISLKERLENIRTVHTKNVKHSRTEIEIFNEYERRNTFVLFGPWNFEVTTDEHPKQIIQNLFGHHHNLNI